MSLDIARAALVRRMLAYPDTWPGPKLAMKRIEGDRIVQFGRLDVLMPSGHFVICIDHPAKLLRFERIEDVIKAGWAVDARIGDGRVRPS